MGRLIPAGTGLSRAKRIGIQVEAPEGMFPTIEETEVELVPLHPSPALAPAVPLGALEEGAPPADAPPGGEVGGKS